MWIQKLHWTLVRRRLANQCPIDMYQQKRWGKSFQHLDGTIVVSKKSTLTIGISCWSQVTVTTRVETRFDTPSSQPSLRTDTCPPIRSHTSQYTHSSTRERETYHTLTRKNIVISFDTATPDHLIVNRALGKTTQGSRNVDKLQILTTTLLLTFEQLHTKANRKRWT